MSAGPLRPSGGAVQGLTDRCLRTRTPVIRDGRGNDAGRAIELDFRVPQTIRAVVPDQATIQDQPPEGILPREWILAWKWRLMQSSPARGAEKWRLVAVRPKEGQHVTQRHVHPAGGTEHGRIVVHYRGQYAVVDEVSQRLRQRIRPGRWPEAGATHVQRVEQVGTNQLLPAATELRLQHRGSDDIPGVGVL